MTDLNPCHPAEQQARQDELDRLYEADTQRHDPAHPHHSTYTGLVAGAAAESDPTAEWGKAAPRSKNSMEADLLVDAVEFLQREDVPLDTRIEGLVSVLNLHFIDGWELTFNPEEAAANA
jgi:hypothetical protein